MKASYEAVGQFTTLSKLLASFISEIDLDHQGYHDMSVIV